MTNATVGAVTSAPQGQVIKVTYKDGEAEVPCRPRVRRLSAMCRAIRSLLKPGAAVFIVAQKKPDGTLTAARVTAEKDGVKPPM